MCLFWGTCNSLLYGSFKRQHLKHYFYLQDLRRSKSKTKWSLKAERASLKLVVLQPYWRMVHKTAAQTSSLLPLQLATYPRTKRSDLKLVCCTCILRYERVSFARQHSERNTCFNWEKSALRIVTIPQYRRVHSVRPWRTEMTVLERGRT